MEAKLYKMEEMHLKMIEFWEIYGKYQKKFSVKNSGNPEPSYPWFLISFSFLTLFTLP